MLEFLDNSPQNLTTSFAEILKSHGVLACTCCLFLTVVIDQAYASLGAGLLPLLQEPTIVSIAAKLAVSPGQVRI